MNDARSAPDADSPAVPRNVRQAAARRGVAAPLSEDSALAVEIRGLVERGAMDEARERFSGLVTAHQRRASRIAYQYLRDASEADEAVQDAFLKVFSHIGAYREAWPFEVWFTRILINGCLDRRKARGRRDRWFVGGEISNADEARASAAGPPRRIRISVSTTSSEGLNVPFCSSHRPRRSWLGCTETRFTGRPKASAITACPASW